MKKFCKEHPRIAICVALVVSMVIIPMIVTGLVSFNILSYVETDNDWIGFWGGYLGAIMGSGIAVYVLVKTLKDNKRMQNRQEVIDFCNYVVARNAEFAQKYESVLYRVHEYMLYVESKASYQKEVETYKEFLNEFHNAKVILFEILQHLEIRKEIILFHTLSMEKTIETADKAYSIFKEFDTVVSKAKSFDGIEQDNMVSVIESFLNMLKIYEKELLKKIIN